MLLLPPLLQPLQRLLFTEQRRQFFLSDRRQVGRELFCISGLGQPRPGLIPADPQQGQHAILAREHFGPARRRHPGAVLAEISLLLHDPGNNQPAFAQRRPGLRERSAGRVDPELGLPAPAGDVVEPWLERKPERRGAHEPPFRLKPASIAIIAATLAENSAGSSVSCRRNFSTLGYQRVGSGVGPLCW